MSAGPVGAKQNYVNLTRSLVGDNPWITGPQICIGVGVTRKFDPDTFGVFVGDIVSRGRETCGCMRV